MKKRKRAISAAVCLFLCLAIFFLIWVNNDYGRNNLLGRSSLPPQRTIRQLMLPDAEKIYRSEDDIIIYDAGKYMLMLEEDWPAYALCEFENGAAFLSNYSLSPYTFDKDIWLPIYAYTRSHDAAYADMELLVNSSVLSSDPDEPLQGEYLFPSVPYKNGIAYFPMSWHSRFVGEETLINSFHSCVMKSSIVNGIYYRAMLRFYDAEGSLISESVFEMGEKES